MNNKAQMELNAWGVIFGAVGCIFGYWMASRMNPGLIWEILTGALTGVAGFIIASMAANN